MVKGSNPFRPVFIKLRLFDLGSEHFFHVANSLAFKLEDESSLAVFMPAGCHAMSLNRSRASIHQKLEIAGQLAHSENRECELLIYGDWSQIKNTACKLHLLYFIV